MLYVSLGRTTSQVNAQDLAGSESQRLADHVFLGRDGHRAAIQFIRGANPSDGLRLMQPKSRVCTIQTVNSPSSANCLLLREQTAVVRFTNLPFPLSLWERHAAQRAGACE